MRELALDGIPVPSLLVEQGGRHAAKSVPGHFRAAPSEPPQAAVDGILAHAPLATVSTYAYVNPIVAIALGVLFRNEHLSLRTLLGAAVVVGAVAVVVGREPPVATLPEEGVR